MHFDEFCTDLQDILQTDVALNAVSQLAALEEWDSLAQMALMAWFDRRLGKRIDFKHIQSCTTVRELAALADGNISI